MKKNTKGFTLIELLAVIVILAVIALIASPIILRVIENSRKSSQGRSVESFASAVINASTEVQYQKADVSGEFTVKEDPAGSGEYEVCDKNDPTACSPVEYSGSRVKNCDVVIENGYVAMKGCKVGNATRTFHYNNGKKKINEVDPTSGGAVADEEKASN